MRVPRNFICESRMIAYLFAINYTNIGFVSFFFYYSNRISLALPIVIVIGNDALTLQS